MVYFHQEVILIAGKSILVYAIDNSLRHQIKQVQRERDGIFLIEWFEDFEFNLQKHKGQFDVVAIECSRSFNPDFLFDLVRNSGFTGKVYALTQQVTEEEHPYEVLTPHIWPKEMFIQFAYSDLE